MSQLEWSYGTFKGIAADRGCPWCGSAELAYANQTRTRIAVRCGCGFTAMGHRLEILKILVKPGAGAQEESESRDGSASPPSS